MQYYPQQNPYNYNMAGMYNGIPANPIGNIAPLGYGGYNYYGTGNTYNMGGYYSGLYNNYNPYLIKQQQELYAAQLREQQRQQCDIYSKLYKASCSYLGCEPQQDILESFNDSEEDYLQYMNDEEKNIYFKKKQQEDYIKYNQQKIFALQNMQPNMYYQQASNAYYNAYQKIYSDYKKAVPDDMSLQEYLEGPGRVDYLNYLEREERKKKADLSKLYNKNDYDSLLNMHKHTLFGNSVFNPDASIDDQEVHLPNMVSEVTKQERRRRFMEALLSKGGELR